MSEWHEIETAPKAAAVLVWAHGVEPVSAVFRQQHPGHKNAFWAWQVSADLFECFHPTIQFEPTHWMPLPEPPK